jgi:hypothetical protein
MMSNSFRIRVLLAARAPVASYAQWTIQVEFRRRFRPRRGAAAPQGADLTGCNYRPMKVPPHPPPASLI